MATCPPSTAELTVPAHSHTEQAGVGLLLGEQKDSNIVLVKQVVPRGSADRTGRIRVGDQILRVGGADAVGMGVTDLRNLIIGEQVSAAPFPRRF